VKAKVSGCFLSENSGMMKFFWMNPIHNQQYHTEQQALEEPAKAIKKPLKLYDPWRKTAQSNHAKTGQLLSAPTVYVPLKPMKIRNLYSKARIKELEDGPEMQPLK
jgi:hypothetical protein